MASTYSSVSGKCEPVSRKTTSMSGSTPTAMSMSTASWNEHEMASFEPNRSTAQARTSPAGAVSKAAARSASSSRNRPTAGSTASSASLVRLSTTLSFTSTLPLPPGSGAAAVRAPSSLRSSISCTRRRNGALDRPPTAPDRRLGELYMTNPIRF